MTFYIILLFLCTYLICSINPAILICKQKTGEDIRKLGSGNAGTANAMRVLGRVLGTVVIILDIAKVLGSYFIATKLTEAFGYTIEMTTFKNTFILSAIIGHCYPLYYGFKGGKGVVVGMTLMALIEPKIVMICIISGLIVMALTRTVAIGTISGTLLFFVISLFNGCDYIVGVTIAVIIVMFKHRWNIQRILTGQEHKF